MLWMRANNARLKGRGCRIIRIVIQNLFQDPWICYSIGVGLAIGAYGDWLATPFHSNSGKATICFENELIIDAAIVKTVILY